MNASRLLLLALPLALWSCGGTPSPGSADGRADAVSDASTDAGRPVSEGKLRGETCSNASECTRPLTATSSCRQPVNSCIDHHCITECSGAPRTCTFEGGCLTCGTTRSCLGRCSTFRFTSAVIEDLVCDPGVTPPFSEGPVRTKASGQCGEIAENVGEFDLASPGLIAQLGPLGLCTGTVSTSEGNGLRFAARCAACTVTLRMMGEPTDAGR